MLKQDKKVLLSVPLDNAFVSVATSVVENAAAALGLGRSEALSLTLSAEEIFTYLCRVGGADQTVTICCTGGVYYVQTDFEFSVKDFDMRAFNITAKARFDDEAGLQEMGLLIASRSVDRFQILEKKGQGMRLSLIKEKVYPPGGEESADTRASISRWTLKRPHAEELKLFSLLVKAHHSGEILPEFFEYPGKVIDMVASGAYQASVALSPEEALAGGILWHWMGERTVECFGPYVFNVTDAPSLSEALIEACLSTIAKTPAVGLIVRFASRHLPRAHFEPLGTLSLTTKAGRKIRMTAYFRQLLEDPGLSVWVHPVLKDFLEKEYARLVLPRNIRGVTDKGETRHRHSVLSSAFVRSQSQVTLRPLRYGADSQANLKAHIRLFHEEGIRNVFFSMDLGIPWQVGFIPFLLEAGFSPRVILPHAGRGDMLLFQWEKQGK